MVAILTSSGQAANFYAVFNICPADGHFVSTNTIYGSTYNLFGVFGVTIKKLGIECTFVDPDWDDAKYMDGHTTSVGEPSWTAATATGTPTPECSRGFANRTKATTD